jgi:cellulose synthase/poly-beta-1,6-N-acetylglucosamine synthase-like glycosyltransferase
LILRSLQSIAALDYPKDKLQILIGDDLSQDNTVPIIQAFIDNKSNFYLVPILDNLGKGRGKANVLAQLAHLAKGEYYFITDVDVKLPTQWIKGLLKEFTPQVGIASGTTLCEKGDAFSTLQAIDWLHFMGYIKSFANVGIGCTAVGNNMAVRAEAYWQTGGFEHLDFSITEDYKLFQEVTKKGWEWRTTLQPETVGKAWAISSVWEMLHQRKRWLIGAAELPNNWKALIGLYGLFVPALIVLFYFNWQWALLVWLFKWLIQIGFIQILCKKVKVPFFSLVSLVQYEFYVIANTTITAIFYLLPFKTKWKRRKYSRHNLT